MKILVNACSFTEEYMMPIWCPKDVYIKFRVEGKWRIDKQYDYTDSKDLVAKLNDDAIQKMAQRQNVPVELLQEIEALRQDSAQLKAQQRRDAAAIGFQQVMDTYKLTQDELKAFAVELDNAGKNPFEQPIDLMAEYKIMHYDDILQAAVKSAVEEALKKDSAATQSSSTPAQQQGGNGGENQKITTVAGLTALLNDAK